MYDTFIRAAKPWAYRYPLEEVQGAYGDPREPDNHSASRYVEMRASELADLLFAGLKKNCVSEWYDNYDDTEKIPSVFPSIGFWNVVNGCSGIAVSMSTSVPQFNLKEVNEALITLINNPDTPCEDLICYPDFATGCDLINRSEVFNSLVNGNGKACALRAKLIYDPSQNMIQCINLPYGVFTSTVIKQLAELTDMDENYGIERVVDHTKKSADIRIYLTKGANPKRMIEKLYSDTSLQSFFAINMIMLDKGRFPKVFTWKEALQAYIDHMTEGKTREYQYDKDKLLARNHIIDGLLLAIANMDDVVSIIRGSDDTSEAKTKLIDKYNFSDAQIKAIFDLKLQRLVRLDGIKLENERADNIKSIAHLDDLLTNKELFNGELVRILRDVASKFGDDRRTKIMDLRENTEKVVAPEENISVFVMSNNSLRLVKTEDLSGSKRGRKGTSIKLPKNVVLSDTLYTTNQSKVAVISNKGKLYFINLDKLDAGIDYSIFELVNIGADEEVIKIIDANQFDYHKYIIFVTHGGLIKKSLTYEYNTMRNGLIGIKLKENDFVVNCFLSNNDEDRIFVVSNRGNYNYYPQDTINPTGRNTSGVQAIKLNGGEYVASADIQYRFLDYIGVLSINNNGRGKMSSLQEFNQTTRAIKGSMIQKLNDDEEIACVKFIPSTVSKVNVLTNNKITSMAITEVPLQGRATCGVQLINAREVNTKLYVIAE